MVAIDLRYYFVLTEQWLFEDNLYELGKTHSDFKFRAASGYIGREIVRVNGGLGAWLFSGGNLLIIKLKFYQPLVTVLLQLKFLYKLCLI